jgi:leucyl/phenylalanyl-tRNA---protein transferase
MVFELNDDLWFPDPLLADSDGLLAVGGDLSIPRLLLAYSHGIFPWYGEDQPILWFSPHKRFVLYPEELKVSKTMRKFLRTNNFQVTINKAFDQVIDHCSSVPRKGQDGTWLNGDMLSAYRQLHREGYALSVEVWKTNQLVGGLYGVICGSSRNIFCGESMFSLLPNTSKLALIRLCQAGYFRLIDCQIESPHLRSLGARLIGRLSFDKLLIS